MTESKTMKDSTSYMRESDTHCPLCDTLLSDDRYPRHRIVLEDESDSAPNQRKEKRLCSDCWNNLLTKISSTSR